MVSKFVNWLMFERANTNLHAADLALVRKLAPILPSSSQSFRKADYSCPSCSFPALPIPISWRASFRSSFPPIPSLCPSAHWSSTSVMGLFEASVVESVSIATLQAAFPQSGPALATPGTRITSALYPPLCLPVITVFVGSDSNWLKSMSSQ